MPSELTARVPRHASRLQREQAASGQAAQREYRREAWEMALRRNKAVRWLVSWLPHRVTIALRTLLRWQHSVIAKIRQRWRRSLQLRVIGTTLVISATMIAVLGFFLTEQIAAGLLANAEGSAHNQALAGLNAAWQLPGYNSQPASNSAAESFMTNAARHPWAAKRDREPQLLRRGWPQDGLRAVVQPPGQPERRSRSHAAADAHREGAARADD